ncbi:Hsp20/alpha crystallin family protein [Alkalicoccobacillus porphyridii]|uniref:Hsp20/alpha crystallin family protein n=1 Tax=Alkalicoccobacillus porphyridii TaxID=2597270 RepID=UPI00163DC8C6|nr:Hsp20/alpha crystallin family protein [Alkalicoccobacillus porphyridii]
MSDHKSDEGKSSLGYHDVMRSIDDFFHQTYRRFQPPPLFSQSSIPVRTTDEGDAFIIQAELPGIDKQLIRLESLPHALVIRVLTEVSSENRIEKERYISVPFVYNESDIKASYQNGLLHITIQRKRQQISIE